ncbi:MAG: NADH-quinone oxidoreductase subunit NuoE [Actinomycetota bacterium]
MPVLTDEERREAQDIKARYPEPRSAMLPLLYLVQSSEGHLTREGLAEVGELLGLQTAEVEAVATFYSMFRMRPTGRYVVAVCTNVSCALLGAKRLYERAHAVLGPDAESVTSDGAITLHEEECLGACEQAPLIQVNWLNYARMTEESLVDLLDQLRAGTPPPSTQGPVPQDLKTTCRILAGLGEPTGWLRSTNGDGSGVGPGAAAGALSRSRSDASAARSEGEGAERPPQSTGPEVAGPTESEPGQRTEPDEEQTEQPDTLEGQREEHPEPSGRPAGEDTTQEDNGGS